MVRFSTGRHPYLRPFLASHELPQRPVSIYDALEALRIVWLFVWDDMGAVTTDLRIVGASRNFRRDVRFCQNLWVFAKQLS